MTTDRQLGILVDIRPWENAGFNVPADIVELSRRFPNLRHVRLSDSVWAMVMNNRAVADAPSRSRDVGAGGDGDSAQQAAEAVGSKANPEQFVGGTGIVFLDPTPEQSGTRAVLKVVPWLTFHVGSHRLIDDKTAFFSAEPAAAS